jgi:hypothetical protein
MDMEPTLTSNQVNLPTSLALTWAKWVVVPVASPLQAKSLATKGLTAMGHFKYLKNRRFAYRKVTLV